MVYYICCKLNKWKKTLHKGIIIMKKRNMLIAGVAAGFLLIGLAVATWASSVDISINAGSGELDIEIVETKVISSSNYVSFENTDISISKNGKIANVTIDNIYPGSEAVFEVCIRNTGTIPVKLSRVNQRFYKIIDTETGKNYRKNIEIISHLSMEYSIQIYDASGAPHGDVIFFNAETLKKLGGNMAKKSGLENLEPGETLVLTATFAMDSGATDLSEHKLFKFKVSPIFVQGVK